VQRVPRRGEDGMVTATRLRRSTMTVHPSTVTICAWSRQPLTAEAVLQSNGRPVHLNGPDPVYNTDGSRLTVLRSKLLSKICTADQ
jgi:hypothetical protein